MSEKKQLVLSTLPKTWFVDIDGTLVKHNGYRIDGHDTLLPGAKEYMNEIPDDDRVILTTSRTDKYKEQTLEFLKANGVRFDDVIFNLPFGERIVVNDRKPSGTEMSVAINLDRDEFEGPVIRRET